jgi:hypothetical protein
LLSFGPSIATALLWLFRRLRSNQVIGILAITAGEGGLGLTGALMYVWVAYLIPANVAIGSRLPLPNALYLYAGLIAAAIVFSVLGASSFLSTCVGVCKLAPYHPFANLLRRYIFRRPIKRRFSAATIV